MLFVHSIVQLTFQIVSKCKYYIYFSAFFLQFFLYSDFHELYFYYYFDTEKNRVLVPGFFKKFCKKFFLFERIGIPIVMDYDQLLQNRERHNASWDRIRHENASSVRSEPADPTSYVLPNAGFQGVGQQDYQWNVSDKEIKILNFSRFFDKKISYLCIFPSNSPHFALFQKLKKFSKHSRKLPDFFRFF